MHSVGAGVECGVRSGGCSGPQRITIHQCAQLKAANCEKCNYIISVMNNDHVIVPTALAFLAGPRAVLNFLSLQEYQYSNSCTNLSF